ncbi:MAG: CCA tRNA nucleotidyltransferase [Hyphomicrobiales bacterium]
MTGRLPSLAGAAWLTTRPVRQVFDALRAAGGEARVAGGAVRNALMGEPIGDIDIATTLTPEAVMEAGKAAGLSVHPTGIAHGTVMLVASGQPFEVTTLRVDVETFGRKARVEFTDDWAADARRRDFTMNALYCSPNGEIHDPVGGYPDILAKKVRFVGDPEARIKEDYLRILRYFRFESHYGGETGDRASLEACVRLQDGLDRLSAERIRQEFFKLLVGKGAVPILRVMDEHGVLAHVLPHTKGFGPIERMARIDRHWGLTPDPLLRLATIATDALGLRERLKLTNAEVERLTSLFLHAAPTPNLRPGERERVLYQVSEQAFRDAVRVAWARSSDPVDDAAWHELLDLAQHWKRPQFPVRGSDLVARGLTGPAVGETLRRLEDWWIASGFTADRDDLLARVARERN